MKILKFTVLFLTMFIINSCNSKKDDICCSPGSYQHLLWISFQDESGNDLLEGTEFVWSSNYGMIDTSKPELYTLDIIYKDGIPNMWNLSYDYPRLYLAKGWLSPPESSANPNYNYLWFETFSSRIVPKNFAEKVVFRLICFPLFGDNEAHDIVTWWKPIGTINPNCYRVEYGGKEFPVEEQHVAAIVLDSK